jgi:hypothetical protein
MLVALAVGIGMSDTDAVLAEGKGKAKAAARQTSAPSSPTPFSKVVRARFKKWDLNGDGELTMDEIHKAMANPRIKGDAAAAVAAIRCIEREVNQSDRRAAATSR